jgi:hypothetical protein
VPSADPYLTPVSQKSAALTRLCPTEREIWNCFYRRN